jgi:hypothetical protein
MFENVTLPVQGSNQLLQQKMTINGYEATCNLLSILSIENGFENICKSIFKSFNCMYTFYLIEMKKFVVNEQ